MADPARGFRARQAGASAIINAGFSLAFFLGIFGLPGRSLSLAGPDNLALDFLPQAAAVGLMSATVPVLVTRRRLAVLRGTVPCAISRIVLAALAFAALSAAVGGLAALIALRVGPAELPGWPALAIKLGFGGLLGAGVTALALRPQQGNLP